jgi:phosphoribosylformylglycinamidine synthase subunit PurQ / glutaminase
MTKTYNLEPITLRKSKPKVLIFSGYGLNTEDETKSAFEMAGAMIDIVHINDIIARPAILNYAQIVVFPGGFSYGDDTGSGKAYGNRMKQHLGEELQKFLARDTLAIGICNGFQIITSAGSLPGALIANDPPACDDARAGSARYICRWVDLRVTGDSPWLTGIKTISIPIAHGEGKYYAPIETLAKLAKENAIALKYVEGETSKHFALPANPNGSLDNIAGITGYRGRVLGLMPHPERAVRFTQLPHWTYLKEQFIRDGKALPTEGPGLQIFKNAVNYFL